MPLNFVVIPLVFLAAIYVLATYGLARTFVLVYLPATIFFFLAVPIKIPGLPDLSVMSSVGYATLAMLFYRWNEVARVRWNGIDIVIALMMLAPAASVLMNNTLWDAVSKCGDLFFSWVLPYFLGRVAFTDPEARKLLLKVVCICLIISGVLAAFEARLKPLFVSRTYDSLNLNFAPNSNQQVFERYGLMRARSSFAHPIDLGNCAVLLGGLVIALCPITGRRWTEPLPLAGILGAGAMLVGSVSFTCFVMAVAAFGLMYVFSRPEWGKRLPVATIVGLGVLIVSHMTYMLQHDFNPERPTDKLEESMWIRIKIARESWDKLTEAGLLGGGQYIDTSDIAVGSVDNAYILFVLQSGWLHLVGWVCLAIAIGVTGARALRMSRTASERLPVAAALAALIATMLAMYTVFYGFIYALVFLMVLGIFSTMLQMLRDREMAQAAVPYARFAPGGLSPQVGYQVRPG